MLSYSVIGTGAIGGYYGGRLAESGRTVRFLARGDARPLAERGLTVHSPLGDFSIPKPEVFDDPTRLPASDVLVVSLKTTSNASLRDILAPSIRPGTVILVLQNGLGMEEEVSSWFPEALVVGGMCFICAQKRESCVVRHLDYGSVTLAPLDARASGVLESIRADFEASRVPVTVSASLGEARWRKLLWNIPYNGLSVVLGRDTRELMDGIASRRMVRLLMQEVVVGARALGFGLADADVDRMLEFTDRMTAYEPSMKLDADAGRPMEIEYMYRRPLAAARAAGVRLGAIELLAESLAWVEERRGKAQSSSRR